jgi:ubiquinone/menaquinone biosynthesis C-methylase UbiE
MTTAAERFFRDSEYWRAWSQVPDATADIPYALAALDPGYRRVLDVPCGRGRLLKAVRAALPETEIHGLDINAGMIEQVRHECQGVQTHVGSVYALPFPDRHFDAVLCQLGLMFFPDPASGLVEFRRVLRPGRRAALCVACPVDLPGRRRFCLSGQSVRRT